ncbi:MurR/RpiR family transcriptional regulator [uncultured Jannaschia sp.]|uniref:MurR/RpiR family transcriptional regulator n=1 Tax=uncultured Jannaschia sp. TaxID=293347 RepID=UPI00260953C0|nr:MurR/RpiR family transcriptional regulator [uncultured Jannaschia sp.]
METDRPLAARLSEATGLTPAEARVADYLAAHRQEAMFASAQDLADAAGASDATVIRAVRKLGFAGLAEMRRQLGLELELELGLSDRIGRSISRIEAGGSDALSALINLHARTLDALRDETVHAAFARALDIVAGPGRVVAFGIGPSGHMAAYLATQLARLGADTLALTATGLSFADDLGRLRPGDRIVALAYGRASPELAALFDRAVEMDLPRILVTAPGGGLPDGRADAVLFVPRGQADAFSLHAGTLLMLEALVLGYAGLRRDVAMAALDRLNGVRRRLGGPAAGLPVARG